jgi:superfamily II DNA or RNA helicase
MSAAALASKIKPEISVRLTNRWAVFDCDPDLHAGLKDCFGYYVPTARFTRRYQDDEWDGWKTLFLRGRVASGLFLQERNQLTANYNLRVHDARQPAKFRTGKTEGLRPYQIAALNAMIVASTGGIILSATGSGKTRLAGAYFKRLVGAGCFVCDELALLEQSRLSIEETLGESVGVVGNSTFAPRRITVATIQTLAKHRHTAAFQKWFSSIVAVVIDEIHVALNKRNVDVISQVKPLAVFGLTATLEMKKPHVSVPAVALAGPVIFSYPLQQGVEEGYLSKGVVINLRFVDPLRGPAQGYWTVVKEDRIKRKVFLAPWHPQSVYRYHVSRNKARNDLVEKIAREGVKRGRRIVVLAERRDHLQILDKRLADVQHQTVSGSVAGSVRLDAMREMDAGTLPLILATRVFSKGVDVSSVDLIIDATGLPGRNGVIQRYGRGTRMAASKRGLIYVNIADTGSPLAGAALSRAKALKELGTKTITLRWSDAAAVFTAANQVLVKLEEQKR